MKTKHVRVRLDFTIEVAEEIDSLPGFIGPTSGDAMIVAAVRSVLKGTTDKLVIGAGTAQFTLLRPQDVRARARR